MTKTDFDKKIVSFNRKVTLNKTKHLEVQKKISGLMTNDYNFSIDKMHFISNNGFQNKFTYQSTLYMLELK